MIKSIFTLSALVTALLLTSCNNSQKENKASADSVGQEGQQQTKENQAKEKTSEKTSKFDIIDVPVSDADLGTFPFFSLPEDLAPMNKPVQKKYDRLFFAIDSVMTPLEGKVWKSNITPKSGKYDEWSLAYFEKSYDEAIKAVGGVKIFDGQITHEEYDRYHNDAPYLGEEGSIGYTGEQIKTYVIHRADGGDVYIQLTGNTAGGKLNILQTEPFKQTITMLKSDQIEKELTEKGKAILYINFDLDKASLKPDGKVAVAEIVKVLDQDKNLKLSIEGHTDNSGSADHNKKLSEDRATTVLNELTASGIDKARLKALGYGAEKPLVANDSEENKAKNRRVELVKIN